MKYWTIRNGSKEYAEKLILKTKDIIDLICAHPSAFKATNYPETRMATFGNFSIFFKATEQEIIIAAFGISGRIRRKSWSCCSLNPTRKIRSEFSCSLYRNQLQAHLP